MNAKNLFFLNTIVASVFGLLFVLVPEQTLSLYGISMMSRAGLFVGQLFGSALIGIGIIAWYARSMSADAQDGIMMAIIVGHGVGFIVSLIAQLQGISNNLGWSTVLLYLFFSLGFAYLKYIKPSS